MGSCAIVSFRLGFTDGVSVVSASWQRALESIGWSTYTVAGDGPVDHLVDGLGIDHQPPPQSDKLASALASADLVLVENVLSIPLNLPASRVLAEILADRPAVLHHHDPPWQRTRFANVTELPADDRCWRHVTINRLTERQFAERGLTATTIYNGFDLDPPPGRRLETRQRLGLSSHDRLVAHPVRAIERKNIPEAVNITERVGGIYWLPGPAEEGYVDELDRIVATAQCSVLRTPIDGDTLTMSDLYAASDLIVFPSTWEGFGNPPIEAAIHGRPVVVGRYPVADELRQLGFRWLDVDDHDDIARALTDPSAGDVSHNRRIVEDHLSETQMAQKVERLLEEAGWKP